MRNSRKRAAKESPAPQEEAKSDQERSDQADQEEEREEFSWHVEWSGTFPIGKVTAENVAKRLDALVGAGGGNALAAQRRLAGTRALLSISAGGVRATAEDEAKTLFLAHPLRKVCCVLGRVHTCQLAYITREHPSLHGHHHPYRKQCHVFRTASPEVVERIEATLSNAFQRALNGAEAEAERKRSPDTEAQMPEAKVPTMASAESPMKTPKRENSHANRLTDPRRNRVSSQMRLSSSALLQRIFGSSGAASMMTPKKQLSAVCSPAKKMLTPSTPSTSGFRFRRPRWPLAPFRSSASSPSAATPKGLRRVAPVLPAPCASSSASSSAASVVLPLAPTRLSTATTATIGADKKAPYAFPMPSTIPRTLWPEGQKAPPAEPEELVYDERLKEWIFPIGETMAEELERLAYFCRTAERELVMSHLRHMPPGHFVLRVSGSRRRCLALSVRVAEDPQRNPKGIAHYLLLRNQHGFRIRGSRRYFPSLPMLVTHHSVLAEQLPCRLLLSDWRWTRGGDPSQREQRRRQSSGGSTLAVLRAHEERGDQQQDHFGCQSPDSTLVRWRRPLPLPGAMATTDVRTQTNSTLFSSKSSTILSA